jgi:ABC-type glycerol-3-phosphate transport system substrate-binding protein
MKPVPALVEIQTPDHDGEDSLDTFKVWRDMLQTNRYRLSWLVLSVVWASLAGCGGEEKGDAENGQGKVNVKPYAGLTIDVAIPAGRNLASDWELPVSEWSVQHDAEVRLQEYAFLEGNATISDMLKESTGEMPEVMLIPWSAVPELVAQDALAEIPEAVQQAVEWHDIYPGLRIRAAQVARKPRLVPVSCPVLVCYYRHDLLEKAGLFPPSTWAEYQTLLETMKDWAPGLVAVEPWSEPFRATMFLARSASIAKHPEQLSFCFQLRDAAPLIENPGFLESLKVANAALALMPPEVRTFSPGECRREILAGRAALAIGYETDLAQDVKRGEEVELGIVSLPGSTRVYNTAINQWVDFDEQQIHRVTLTGFDGWAMAVSTKADQPLNGPAWQFTQLMAKDQLEASFPASMLSLCRHSQMEPPTPWTGRELTILESDEYVNTVMMDLVTNQVVMEFPVLGRNEFRAALTRGLTKAFDQPGQEAAVLESIADDWREIIEQIGPEAVIKSHQRSHE